MKVKASLALVAAVLAGLGAPTAFAQSSSIYNISDSTPIQAELASFGGGHSCESCGAAASGKSGGGKSGSGKSGSKGGCDSCCESEPWRLFPEIGCGWSLTGWVAVGATANADRPGTRLNGPVTFNDRANFQGNQFYTSFGRDVDTDGCGMSWGARVDLMFGSDFFFTQAVGLETHDDGRRHWNRSGNQYGWALPQAYGEVAFNNLSVKLGHFYTIIGNEVVTAPDNFFYSHAYTMQYGEPFTHTGGLATWQFADNLALYGGLVNGWDKFDATSDRVSFLGGFTYTPSDERFSLTATMIHGDEDGSTGIINQTRTMYSVVLGFDINDRWSYLLQHDNGWNNLAGANLDQEWYGVNQYLFYTINDCWKVGLRGEWFRDDDGSRMSSIPLRNGPGGPVLPAGVGAMGPAAFAGNYYNVSAGLNWTPSPNIIVRPELRLDWSDGTAVAPFDNFTKDSQLTAAFDAILLF